MDTPVCFTQAVRWLDPDADFSPVIREWAKEVPKELDFLNEVFVFF